MIISFNQASKQVKKVSDEDFAARLRAHIILITSRDQVGSLFLLGKMDPVKAREFTQLFLEGLVAYADGPDLNDILELLIDSPDHDPTPRAMIPDLGTDLQWYMALCREYPFPTGHNPFVVYQLMRACASCLRFVD